MAEERKKKDDIFYVQRDLEQIKHTLDAILKPYKADVRRLQEENISLREGARAREREIESIMLVIAKQHPEMVDDLLASLVSPSRRGWKKFRASWRYRLGLDER